ncbi:peptidoglycan endopeptidase RipB-like [Oppia nitens]|uniref:peptidoglycan endopeptidase RipB-like n=1 Tax=Oppia nitens TaxID=1686743 RepID=UPI0023DA7377|nr:peptidoglycan endopeptidase RipB-like [Oppia nitens]
MKVLLIATILLAIYLIDETEATGAQIVAAARTQIGVPYSWGGGGYKGKSKGIDQGAHTVGFDCSGLAQYAVYHGTGSGKIIARVAASQYADKHCHHVSWGQHQPGDLVFFNDGGSIHHVGIVSSATHMIQAPHTGDHVRESAIPTTGRMAQVTRCY